MTPSLWPVRFPGYWLLDMSGGTPPSQWMWIVPVYCEAFRRKRILFGEKIGFLEPKNTIWCCKCSGSKPVSCLPLLIFYRRSHSMENTRPLSRLADSLECPSSDWNDKERQGEATIQQRKRIDNALQLRYTDSRVTESASSFWQLTSHQIFPMEDTSIGSSISRHENCEMALCKAV